MEEETGLMIMRMKIMNSVCEMRGIYRMIGLRLSLAK